MSDVMQTDQEEAVDSDPIQSVRVMGDRILIRPVQSRDMSLGGITIPERAKEPPQEGIVVAVGVGSGPEVPMDCHVGDRIYFIAHVGLDVKVGEERFLLIDQAHVMGVANGLS